MILLFIIFFVNMILSFRLFYSTNSPKNFQSKKLQPTFPQAVAFLVRYYFIDYNFGYNGSENFAKGDRFCFFPAFSLAWNIAEEPFIKKHLKWMNMFKVRFSYGKVGNDNVGTRLPYLYTIADR